MSKRPTGKSLEGSDQKVAGSVYDFLYHDARRVGSFLAQLDPDGHLQLIKKSAHGGSTTTSSDILQGEAGVPLVARMQGQIQEQSSVDESRSSDRTYDPLWANALALLDHLEAQSLIHRRVDNASIGQIVLATGSLKVVNLKFLSGIWDRPALKKLLGINLEQNDIDTINKMFGIEVVSALPHTVQATVYVHEEPVSVSWMILEEENMVVSPANILLKHGTWMSGEWSVLGIKDAGADGGPVVDQALLAEIGLDAAGAAAARYTSGLSLIAESMSPFARLTMGRNGVLFGITPLLIFREVIRST